jgi:pimeloyl-ACP methyl ester carboxylesterase
MAVVGAVLSDARAAVEDTFFDNEGVRIRYVVAGGGEPVVLVHGFTASLDSMWVETGVLEALARDFRVVAFDCRGHGRSGKPHEPERYGMRMIEDVRRLLDHLKIERVHLVGYSMGGAIAGKFAATHPDRVRTVVFGGSVPRMRTAQGDRQAIEIAESLEQGRGLRPLIVAFVPPNRQPSDEEIERLSQRQLGTNDPLALAAVQRRNHEQAVTLQEIRALRMPLLAIVGSEDPTSAAVGRLGRISPGMKVVLIDGAGHFAAVRRPEFTAAVREFVSANRDPGRN